MKRRGNCYVTCEALYHLLGGEKSGFVPAYIPAIFTETGDTHWFLKERNPGPDRTAIILDPTAKQFKDEPHYLLGRCSGFLTKKPSKRARELMKRMLWQ